MIFLVLAAVLTFVESSDLYKDIKATTWPTSTGKLSLEYFAAPTYHSIPEHGPIFHPHTTIELRFSYNVDGVNYTSSNKSFGYTLSDNIERINSADKYHDTAKVYYNASDPSEAVLIPGPKVINIGLIILGAFLMLWTGKRVVQSIAR